MKVAYLVPGTGGQFYCENCIRDISLISALRRLGHDVVVVPMYLPVKMGDTIYEGDTPIFYGAVNIYLEQKLPFYRMAPGWLSRRLERLLDTPFVLRLASRLSGTTRASALGDLTLSMVRGEEGYQANEHERLMGWLREEIKPDVIHLSNALLLGPARRIREVLEIPVVCSLQDEDSWVDGLEEDYAQAVWKLLSEKAACVDASIPVSRYYAELMSHRLHLPEDRMHVVPIGVPVDDYALARDSHDGEKTTASKPSENPFGSNARVIGYLSRLAETLGFGLLVEAFVILKADPRFKDLKLRAMGGRIGDDVKFVAGLKKGLARKGLADQLDIVEGFDINSRVRFLKSVTLLSVPVLQGEAFGMYILEALAAGVPVAQPMLGAFPEIVRQTGGGILYDPNTAEALADAMGKLLQDPDRLRELSRRGAEGVKRGFTAAKSAAAIAEVYRLSGARYRRAGRRGASRRDTGLGKQ
jgi:glycosyltransferase involved in cell wall biosynthesis